MDDFTQRFGNAFRPLRTLYWAVLIAVIFGIADETEEPNRQTLATLVVAVFVSAFVWLTITRLVIVRLCRQVNWTLELRWLIAAAFVSLPVVAVLFWGYLARPFAPAT